jgi:hypothetical protein
MSKSALPPHVGTYVERDVRQILNIQNLATFQRFIQLCAGRIDPDFQSPVST